MELTKNVGGYAVAVATNEAAADSSVNEWKRNRLKEAGCDCVIPDSSNPDRLYNFFLGVVKMSFELFDTTRLNIKPLNERVHDIDLLEVLVPVDDSPAPMDNEKVRNIAKALCEAKQKKADSTLMYGAHVIRTGNSDYMIELMRRGLVTHFATNGAGSIHDYEFSLIGHTCESVAKYISEGQFGLWRETGYINEIEKEGVEDGLGAGKL